jgi:hypothetical protein
MLQLLMIYLQLEFSYAAPTCWGAGTVVEDVWFKFVAIATDVTITINGNQGSPVGGTLNRPQVALYSGACGSGGDIICGSPPTGQNIIQVYKGGLTIGETYYIRVDGFNSNNGTFKYCINNYNPVPTPSGDCPTAVVLCDKSGFNVPSVTGAGTNNTEMNDATCFNSIGSSPPYESNSTWYVFTFATSGTFNFSLTPSNPNDDLDFAVYKLPNGIGNCTNKQLVRCMGSSCPGSTGLRSTSIDVSEGINCSIFQDNFLSTLTVVAG